MLYYDKKSFNQSTRSYVRKTLCSIVGNNNIDEIYKAVYDESRIYRTLHSSIMGLYCAFIALCLVDKKDRTRWAEARLNYASACFSLFDDRYPDSQSEGFNVAYEVVKDLENNCTCLKDWELLHMAYYVIGSSYSLWR